MVEIKVTVNGLDEYLAKLRALEQPGEILDRAAAGAAEELRGIIASQPWGEGNWQFPVKTGALRDSGRAEDNVVWWGDLIDYAGLIESQRHFFRPLIEEHGEEVFERWIVQEIERALDAAGIL